MWRYFKPYGKNSTIRTNGKQGKEQQYYQWDHMHNDIEVYDHNKKHIGSMDPETGKTYKLAVPGRKLDV